MDTADTPNDTRSRLIEVAERLFAERGVHAVSLREIATAAGQRNTSAVAYHFGTKRALVEAVYEYRMRPASNRLLAHVADLDARGRGHDLRALVEVMIRTTAENLEGERRPGWFLRFVANAMYVEDIAPFDLTANEWSSGQAALHARIAEHLTDLPPRLRQDRWDHFAGLLVHTLANRERRLQKDATADEGAEHRLLIAQLVDSCTALLSTPASPETLAAESAPSGAR
ncbi:TetR/AcrR family transcriptional regulator [Saccharopolyspora elongata]|uniref:TetR/AcrR family transcriptional regulator n=1 Tax=Saccharopolyspora elongata TaxID=2530387 RepID=A0A4R4XRC5_9PSEU|nr:TetR/AcrR family transcriptional regulator [Saccharopolyspora elongata]TDD33775.1 TetR/AcrR family transcriptional regulator [Saccharopolyspora elongata]